jgi:hypothetical protein
LLKSQGMKTTTSETKTEYTVRYINFGWCAAETFESIEAALAYAQSKGFQAAVERAGVGVVASWCPIGGRRFYGSTVERLS